MIKNWVYGARAPDVEQQVSDAIYKAHAYRNKLCELELFKRQRHDALLRDLAEDYVDACQAVDDAETRLGDARQTIQAERVKQRTKIPSGCDSIRQEIKQIRADLKQLRAKRKTAKKQAHERPAVMVAMRNNAELHKSQCAHAKVESGLYWGTEALVKQSCSSFSSGPPPKFRRFEGEGQLAVQLQGGLDCEDASRPNTLFYIDPWDGKHAVAIMRIGSEGRDPIFARIPIIMHRPLPTGKIKWAYLERRKIANHTRWYIRLAIDLRDTKQLSITNDQPNRYVVVHTGWRSDPDGLRAATWKDNHGVGGKLVLPRWHLDQYLELDRIQSQRDRMFNEAKERLRTWINVQNVFPECVREAKSHIHAWRSPKRLAGLMIRWRSDHVEGDDNVFEELSAWRKKDKHLWQHERRLSLRIVRRRRDMYRNFVAKLADEYDAVVVTPIDAARLCENSQPEDLERDEPEVHRRGKWAAVSELTQFLREKFPLRCVELPATNISRQCCECGHINEIGKKRKVKCGGCDITYDVDDNAVTNTLARGEVALKSGVLLELVAAQEDRDRKAAEKLAKMQQANRAARERRRKSLCA